MIDHVDTLLQTLRIFFIGVLIFASLFLLSILFKSVQTVHASAADSSEPSMGYSGDPNAVAEGMGAAASDMGRIVSATGDEVVKNTQSATSGAIKGTKSVVAATGRGVGLVAGGVAKGAVATGRVAGKGIGLVGNTVGDGVVFVLRVPSNVVGFVTNSSPVRAVTRPSDQMEVPIIDPNSPELKAAVAALPPVPAPQAQAPQVNQGPQWPIHGAVTTNFGVPHWPYQRTHTGLDIADGRPSGSTPIKPFRPGRVIDVVHSKVSLGNHVIVDHGNGVTSVYGHMSSTAVQVGQEVNLETVLGYVGSTGASTGPHLHFEVRVNGQAADPHQFVGGNP